jgi:hypothetical protein
MGSVRFSGQSWKRYNVRPSGCTDSRLSQVIATCAQPEKASQITDAAKSKEEDKDSL